VITLGRRLCDQPVDDSRLMNSALHVVVKR
jgi:hypothetical protein